MSQEHKITITPSTRVWIDCHDCSGKFVSYTEGQNANTKEVVYNFQTPEGQSIEIYPQDSSIFLSISHFDQVEHRDKTVRSNAAEIFNKEGWRSVRPSQSDCKKEWPTKYDLFVDIDDLYPSAERFKSRQKETTIITGKELLRAGNQGFYINNLGQKRLFLAKEILEITTNKKQGTVSITLSDFNTITYRLDKISYAIKATEEDE